MVQGLTIKGQGRLSDGTTVPRVLPGEVIAVSEDNVAHIVTPSTDRVKAKCNHYKSCGGCALMHASDEFVSGWKTQIVANALKAQGLDTDFRTTLTSPERSRRRAKFSGTRTKKGALVGFHARASDVVIGIADCNLVQPEILHAIPVLERLTVLAASRKSEVQFTVTQSSGGLDIFVATEKPITSELRMTLALVAQEYALSRLSWNGETIVELQPPHQQFGKALVKVPAGSFLQATHAGEKSLVLEVLEIVQDAKSVVDLFAGCGTFSVPISEQAEVLAVEGDDDMLAALDDGWRFADGLKKITTETRDLFRRPLEADELNRFDAAVIDPPRAGAQAQIQTLTRSKIKKIAMVSCNPVTFSRDTKTLVDAGFTFDWVRPVDQFRWSSHVELVGSFSRN